MAQTRTTEQTHNRRPKPEVATASWHLTSKSKSQTPPWSKRGHAPWGVVDVDALVGELAVYEGED